MKKQQRYKFVLRSARKYQIVSNILDRRGASHPKLLLRPAASTDGVKLAGSVVSRTCFPPFHWVVGNRILAAGQLLLDFPAFNRHFLPHLLLAVGILSFLVF